MLRMAENQIGKREQAMTARLTDCKCSCIRIETASCPPHPKRDDENENAARRCHCDGRIGWAVPASGQNWSRKFKRGKPPAMPASPCWTANSIRLPPLPGEDPLLAGARAEERRADEELQTLRIQFEAEHPQVIAAQEKLKIAQARVQAEVEGAKMA